MALINYDDYTKESKIFFAQPKQQDIDAKHALFDQQTKTVNDNYDFSVAEAGKAYDESYRENAIQKLINERQVAESMANMGITNSGLSRSQQTAVQLSYANQKAALDRQKQQQIGTLERDRATALSDIAANRQAAIDSINQYYDGLELDRANSRYNTDVTAETERIKAEIEAAAKAQNTASDNLLYTYTGRTTTDGNGNTYNVFVDGSGKEYKAALGYNVYTGDNNMKVYASEANDPNIGFFSNGYQPRGLVTEGGRFKATTMGGGTILKTNITGKEQTVWASLSGKYFIWDGKKNQYVQVPKEIVEQAAKQEGKALDVLNWGSGIAGAINKVKNTVARMK